MVLTVPCEQYELYCDVSAPRDQYLNSIENNILLEHIIILLGLFILLYWFTIVCCCVYQLSCLSNVRPIPVIGIPSYQSVIIRMIVLSQIVE